MPLTHEQPLLSFGTASIVEQMHEPSLFSFDLNPGKHEHVLLMKVLFLGHVHWFATIICPPEH